MVQKAFAKMTITVNYILHHCHSLCFKNYFLFSIMLLDAGSHYTKLLLLFTQPPLNSPRPAP